MKVVEYIPIYGLLLNCEYILAIDGKQLTLKELFANYPGFELTDYHIEQLDAFDRASLYTVLSQAFVSKKIIISILQNLLAAHIKRGGNTEHWVRMTFQCLHSYNTKLRSIIELYLLKLMHFVSSPSLIQSTVSPNPKPLNTSAPKVKEPIYNNLLEAFNSISEYNRIMGILHEHKYCSVNGTWRDYKPGCKETLTKLIKWLAMHGYCKKVIFSPSEIKSIFMNSFRIESISHSTITHFNPALDEFSYLFDDLKK
ncbi:MAG: hypothetical protein WCK84_13610 [Bacteroidota bacterium]